MDRNKNLRIFFYSAMFLIPFFAGQFIGARELSLLEVGLFITVAYFAFRVLVFAKEEMDV